MPSGSDRPSSASQLQFAFAVVLLCGLMQNAARIAARVLRDQALDHGVHAWWATPLGDAILILPLAVLLLWLGTRVTWARLAPVYYALLTFVVVASALFMVMPRLQRWAQLLLGIGIAWQVGLWLSRRSAKVMRALSIALPALLGVTLLVALPLALWPTVRERLDLRGLPPARTGAPNVLLLIWDTVRASSLQLYGRELPTSPSLVALAESGIVFDRAYGTASYTLPSHSSLFTGRWAHELSSTWRVPLDTAGSTLAELLAGAGYRTGAFSANRIYVTREFGLGRGFAHFDEHRLGFQQILRSSTLTRAIANSGPVRNILWFNDELARVRAEDNHRALLRWLKRNPGRPYFAFVNFMEAHEPYLPARSFAERFGWYSPDTPARERRALEAAARHEPEFSPPEVARHALHAYEASIAELDSAVGVMLDDLRRNGLLDNTIIVISADHGEEFGEHDLFGHGNSLYAQSLHVPLVVIYPEKVPAGLRVPDAVSIRDIPATILDLADVDAQIHGTSLRALWEAPGARSGNVVLSEIRHDPRLPASSQASTGDVASAIDDSTQVIRREGGRLEAFDLATDMTGGLSQDTLSVRVLRLTPWLRSKTNQDVGARWR